VTSGANPEQSNLPGAFRYLFVPAGNEPGRWVTGATMPGSVGEVAVGEINGKLYLIGESNLATMAYDIENDTWDDTLAVRPYPGHHHSIEVYDDKLYVIGGLTGAGQGAGRVQIYDPVTDMWTTGADMTWGGGSLNTALIDGLIYVAGGIVGSSTVSNCAVYDPEFDTWTALEPVPAGDGRNHAAAGTDGELFYIFGGRGQGSGGCNCVADGFDSVQIYDLVTDTWITSDDLVAPGSDLAPLPVQRGGTGKAVFYRGEFYVFGGETQNNPGGYADPTDRVYDRVDVYNPITNTWRTEAELPTARHGIFPVLYQSRVFVAGGGWKAGFSSSAVLEIFTRQ
jgi:N-acetylneuraminic acid mutarotase